MPKDLIGLSTVPPDAPPAPKLWFDLPYAVALRAFFSASKMRAQQTTRYIAADLAEAIRTHTIDTLISMLTHADVQSTITPDEGRNVPWHYNNIRAIQTVKQTWAALDGINELLTLNHDGPLGAMVRDIKQRAVVFLEEMIEAGVPGTIQGIIMSRIDRLHDTIKEVLFGASVIGREFSRPLLEQVIGGEGDVVPSLFELRSLELILENDEAREFEYLFKHFLIQEVAYNTMLVNKRKELHASIAHAIELLYADRLVEYYELLAFHYEKAELWDKAAEYLSRSGHKVRQMYSREESENFFERREIAVKKLYQSASVKPDLASTLKAISLPLLAMLIPILPIFFLIRVVGTSQNVNLISQVVVSGVAILLLLWYALSLWYLGVVPFLRGTPKLYDLMEDRIRIIFKDGTNITVHFSEIEQLRIWDSKTNALRPWLYRLADPFGRLEETDTLTFRTWVRDVLGNILPPYTFGVGSGAASIHCRLNSGATIRRFFFPWFNTAMRSRTLSLHPYDTKEFYVQCEVALMKWGKQQI